MTDPDEIAEDVVGLAGALVERESENPPGNERAVAEFLADRLASSPAGFEVRTEEVQPGRPNVVARAGDTGRGSVLLAGHTDVVPADPRGWTAHPYEPHRQGDRLLGRGTADMKGGIAAMVLAAERYLRGTTDPGEVVLAFVVDEEHDGAGMRSFVDGGVDADAAVIGEPTDLAVCVAQKGVARYRVTVHGESAHSGRPDAGTNSIDGMRRVLSRITTLDEQRRATTDHALLAPETVTTTEVESARGGNTVPGRTEATVDWRFLPGRASPEPFDDHVAAALAGVTLDGVPIGYETDREVFARAAEVPTDHDLVAAVSGAATDAGLSGDAVGFDAATDARFLVHDAGVPTVLFGPGSLERDAHTVDESVAIPDLVAALRVYEGALSRLLG